jgi:antitoxin VapB
MSITRVFKSGNSLAVRLPKELAFAEGAEVKVRREGADIIITPARLDMATLVARLRELGPPARSVRRRMIEPPKRDWLSRG